MSDISKETTPPNARQWSEDNPGRTDWIVDQYNSRWTCRSKICDALVVVEKVYSLRSGGHWSLSWACIIGDDVELNTHGVLFDTSEEAKKNAEQTIIPGAERDRLLFEIDEDFKKKSRGEDRNV